jgi:hypothetical protein
MIMNNDTSTHPLPGLGTPHPAGTGTIQTILNVERAKRGKEPTKTKEESKQLTLIPVEVQSEPKEIEVK